MRPRRRARLGWILGVATLACGPVASPPDGAVDPAEGGLVRTPAPVGAPLAPSSSATIAASGGTLASADGSLRLSVPAGALPSATVFTITPIANTARGAIGGAYRLRPEGLTFSTPVTLTFKAPDTYPVGASIAGVGVEYQDKRGYWRRVEGVTRDAAAKTISVTTDHFSDWALTWQTGTAAAEGPIRLVQTVDVPFDAYGRATVFLQGDTATHTVYLLTGTLTVPDSIAVGEDVCVPDQKTKTLPLNYAELQKGQPPVFRWGIGVHWSLSCTAPGGAVTTRLMPALFDTMYINLTRCGGYYEPGQVATPEHLQGAYTKNCGVEGLVNATWDLRACVGGLACEVEGVCRAGVTACTDGIQSCVDSGPAPNGTVCGEADTMVCSEGQCVDLGDQEVGVTVSPIAGLTTTESGGTATFQIVLNKAPTATVTVALSTSSAEGSVAPTSVAFTPQDWSTPQVVTVMGHDDLVADGDVAYAVVTAPATSIDPRYAGLDAPDVQVTNSDDDVAGFTIDPTSGLVTTEAGGTATFQLALSSQPIADVTVQLSSGSTTEGTVSPASVVFTAETWNTPQTVTVSGADDAIADGPVAYSVSIVATSTDAKYVRSAAVGVTNTDDDSAGLTVSPTGGLVTSEAGSTASFTVALNSEPTAEVRIPVASTDTSEGVPSVAELVFTAADWNQAKTVTVTGVDDDVDDGTVAYGIVVGPPSTSDSLYAAEPASTVAVANTDDDVAGISVSPPSGESTSEGETSVTFTVALTSAPLADVSIPLSSSDTTEGTVSPTSVVFTPTNWNATQTVTVTGVDDLVADGDQPFVVLIGPSTSADPSYAPLDPADILLTNLDDDVAGLTISPASGLTTTEAGGTATFQLSLSSEPTADVTVALSSSDATEGTVSPASVVFTPADWNLAQPVTVTGGDDADVDGPVEYAIDLAATSTDPGYHGRTGSASVTNTDND